MATAETAICTALGYSMDASKILAWTNNVTTGQLELIYDGAPGVDSENITVAVFNAHASE
ncbi:MAG TPA: hypothetical protein VHX38_18975 [Pseudonocardiaceae bacterium]|jgi:hypothetical protein|nr:hypothetical protein [Pseudonocardiaceae bacterium]